MSPQGICTITCDGVLDAHTSSQLDQLVGQVIQRGCTKIVCDLNKVTYIASAGVGVFVGYVNTCKEQGGNLVLLYAQGYGGEGIGVAQGYNILEVFNLLGLAEHIPVATTTADAVKVFG